MMQGVIKLRPSEIYFPQDSILNSFAINGTYEGKNIGTVLDEVVYYSNVDAFIKGITVYQTALRNGEALVTKWASMNNRSLWVAKELEQIGEFPEQKEFKIGKEIPHKMRTTANGGTCVVVRKRPIEGQSCEPAPFWKFYEEIETQADRLEFLNNFKTVRIKSGYFSEDLTSVSGTEDDEEFFEKKQWYLDACKNFDV